MVVRGRTAFGYLIAVVGATGLMGSLWLPWYTFEIPQAALDEAVQTARQFGLGPLVTQGAELIRQLGPFHVSAWQAMTATPAVLLVVAVTAGGFALLAANGRATGVARAVAYAGAVGAVLVLYRAVMPPGTSNLLHAAWGLYLALAGTAGVVAGGLLAISGERAEAHAPATYEVTDMPPAPDVWSTAHTVAPPNR